MTYRSPAKKDYDDETFVLPKRPRIWPWLLGIPAITGPILIATAFGQKQVGIAQSFLDAVRTGDARTAIRLSEGPTRDAVTQCLGGAVPIDACPHPVAPVLAVVRSSARIETDWNLTLGWSERCVEADAINGIQSQHLFLVLKRLSDGWRVTALSTTRLQGSACEDSD
jgi:hypothetical protein